MTEKAASDRLAPVHPSVTSGQPTVYLLNAALGRTALRCFCLATALLAIVTSACSPAADDPGVGVSQKLAIARAGMLSDIRYALEFNVPVDSSAPIEATARISFHLSQASGSLVLDFSADGDLIRSLVCNGQKTDFTFSNEHIVVPAFALTLGDNVIEIAFVAGSSSLNRNPEYLHTLFVPDRARSAFPLFDQPDLKAVYDLTLILPADWVAIANAPLQSITDQGDTRAHQFTSTDLISSYLFSFVAGRFETVTRELGGRSITLLHRETDQQKLSRNIDAIFDQHATAIRWMADYTGIDYPFKKLDFALIPAFPYGGMEHVGAIQYRADSLLLEESPSQRQLLNRANLIAHETAHMWFGNLVTMRWFDDVWTKEVFANFMAAKMVNPTFPDVDHELSFMLQHLPTAYEVDRSQGANPIRQGLANLNQAGQLYGAIIYHKAPVMMRQLELLLGADTFQQGMRVYLERYAFANASWPELIEILDPLTDTDLAAWSETWVNSAGRPEFELNRSRTTLSQRDPAAQDRVWPQRFAVTATDERSSDSFTLDSLNSITSLRSDALSTEAMLIFNADGYGYGQFPSDLDNLVLWPRLSPLARGAELINLYESILNGSTSEAERYLQSLLRLVAIENNPLLLDQIVDQARRIYQRLFSPTQRKQYRDELELALWQKLSAQREPAQVRLLFNAWSDLVSSAIGVERLYRIWSGKLSLKGLQLSENDEIRLAEILAIRMPGKADQLLQQQLLHTKNPDSRRRMAFMAPALSPSAATRDRFFNSLALEKNRRTESWVLDALHYLHHPSRTAGSEKYLGSTLALLEEIQVTGDIFFPARWLHVSLQNHHSVGAVATIRSFLALRPDYNPQLRMKILQAADIPFRARAMADAARLNVVPVSP